MSSYQENSYFPDAYTLSRFQHINWSNTYSIFTFVCTTQLYLYSAPATILQVDYSVALQTGIVSIVFHLSSKTVGINSLGINLAIVIDCFVFSLIPKRQDDCGHEDVLYTAFK